jgi:hypothetical protein
VWHDDHEHSDVLSGRRDDGVCDVRSAPATNDECVAGPQIDCHVIEPRAWLLA